MSNTVSIDLNGPLLNYKGQPFKNISSLGLTPQQMMNTSEEELLRLAPNDKLGDHLSSFLVGIIQPKNVEDTVKLSRWAMRINSKMITDEGKMELDEKDLKELIQLFTSNSIPVKNSGLLGSLLIHLEQKETELNQKNINPDISTN